MAQKRYLFKREIGLIPNGDRTSRYRHLLQKSHPRTTTERRTQDADAHDGRTRAAKAHDEKFPTLR